MRTTARSLARSAVLSAVAVAALGIAPPAHAVTCHSLPQEPVPIEAVSLLVCIDEVGGGVVVYVEAFPDGPWTPVAYVELSQEWTEVRVDIDGNGDNVRIVRADGHRETCIWVPYKPGIELGGCIQ